MAVKPAAGKKTGKGQQKHKRRYHRRDLNERIHEIDIAIASALKLIAQRENIVKRDREKLEKHQASLQFSRDKLEKLSTRRARLIQERDNPLSPEEKKALRDQRKAEENKVQILLKMLNDSGKTLDDLLDAMSCGNR